MTEIEWLDIFGDNLRDMLVEVGMSQRELANEIGVDESLVSRYIHKQYIPNLKTIIKIAYVLNCDISELVDFGETIEWGNNMSITIYENFKRYFPLLEPEVVDYHVNGDLDMMVVKLKDGSSLVYDDCTNAIRNLPSDDRSMTEKECRREFGMRLRRIMNLKGVTQEQLSVMTGIQQSQLSNYINGKTSPSFYNVDKIARALDCRTDDLRYIK